MLAYALLLVAAAPDAAAVQALSAGERTPVVAAILTPTGGGARFSVTEVREVLADVLEHSSVWRLMGLDPSLERCGGRSSCFVDLLRSNMQEGDQPQLLFVVSLRRDGYIVPLVYDWPKALAIVAEGRVGSDGPDGDAVLDAKLDEGAVVARLRPTDANTLALLRDALGRMAASLPVAAPTVVGSIELEVDVGGVAVELDGRAIGVIERAGLTRVTDVRPGQREVVLRSGQRVAKAVADVPAGGAARLGVQLDVRGEPFPHAVVWPSVGLLALGSTMLAVGVERADGLGIVCGESCSRPFARLFPGEGAGAGPLAVPLGWSLAAAGASYGVTAILLGDDADWWVAPAVALAVGLVAYGAGEFAGSPP